MSSQLVRPPRQLQRSLGSNVRDNLFERRLPLDKAFVFASTVVYRSSYAVIGACIAFLDEALTLAIQLVAR